MGPAEWCYAGGAVRAVCRDISRPDARRWLSGKACLTPSATSPARIDTTLQDECAAGRPEGRAS
ncbi:hypothetical protein FRAHR75_150086 [Frankia sp. Hr75.2]|nr:hypothetical protein FRAHR75_150086 [Frankia sp. Hr75.2]SQD96623.1 hypothetical protein FMEAI12_3670020 [Parafrankia sp. Ea1.12]